MMKTIEDLKRNLETYIILAKSWEHLLPICEEGQRII